MNVVNSCACGSCLCERCVLLKDITVCGMSGLARRLGVGFGTVRKNRFTTTHVRACTRPIVSPRVDRLDPLQPLRIEPIALLEDERAAALQRRAEVRLNLQV